MFHCFNPALGRILMWVEWFGVLCFDSKPVKDLSPDGTGLHFGVVVAEGGRGTHFTDEILKSIRTL